MKKKMLISEGVLYCTTCSRFYPIIEEIPIMLPDELRDKKQEMSFLKKYKDKLPEKIISEANPWHLVKLTVNFVSESARHWK